MKQIYLLTTNPEKARAAQSIFKESGLAEILPLKLDIPEIQAGSSSEIARHAAVEAYRITGKPVIREDHSFYLKELGFPGPFMAFADKAISVGQLLKILGTLESREAYFELSAAYVEANGKIHDFSYRVPVVMSREIRGDPNLRWERLMMFPGETRTFAEQEPNYRREVWTRNYQAIAELISNPE